MNSSPCKTCEHLLENKKTFEGCVNCEKRFGKYFAKFNIAKGYKSTGICQWPHGCNNKIVRATYCTSHSKLYSGRYAYWKSKGLTKEQMIEKLLAPRRKVGNPSFKKTYQK